MLFFCSAKVLLFRFLCKKRAGSCWFFLLWHTKKAWNPTVAVPRYEAFALPISLEQQREAHADMYTYARTLRKYERMGYTHPEDIYRC